MIGRVSRGETQPPAGSSGTCLHSLRPEKACPPGFHSLFRPSHSSWSSTKLHVRELTTELFTGRVLFFLLQQPSTALSIWIPLRTLSQASTHPCSGNQSTRLAGAFLFLPIASHQSPSPLYSSGNCLYSSPLSGTPIQWHPFFSKLLPLPL